MKWKRSNLMRSIAFFVAVAVLTGMSVFLLFSCGAGVDKGEADKVPEVLWHTMLGGGW